jgi:hypothetical protein
MLKWILTKQNAKKQGEKCRGILWKKNLGVLYFIIFYSLLTYVLSKIENGQRTVGEKIAKLLGKVLHFDYRLMFKKLKIKCLILFFYLVPHVVENRL